MRLRLRVAVVLVGAAAALGTAASPAAALDPVRPLCSAARLVSDVAGKTCSAIHGGVRSLGVGSRLATGNLGDVAGTLIGGGISRVAASATTALAVGTIVAITLGGAKFTLDETGKLLHETTTPQLESTWFSSLYWRVAGIAAVLTLPFLCAAAIQALVRSDLALLARAAFGYLPLAMLAVGIAAPLTMLLLAASDQMSAIITGAAGGASSQFLERAATDIGGLTTLSTPFFAVFVGVIAIAAGLVLWIELLIRSAAVYVVVLMLPLAFAGMVWPARRVWAIRAVELLVALILSKFAIVAVLALGGAALGTDDSHGITGLLAGTALLVMGAFAPWAMLRLLPMTELASGAVGSLRGQARAGFPAQGVLSQGLAAHSSWASQAERMRREAQATAPGRDDEPDPGQADGAAGQGSGPRPDEEPTTDQESASRDPHPEAGGEAPAHSDPAAHETPPPAAAQAPPPAAADHAPAVPSQSINLGLDSPAMPLGPEMGHERSDRDTGGDR